MIRVLIVEDDPFLSLDLASELSKQAFSVIGIAPDVATALDLIEDYGCDVAVLDVNLGKETSAPVARELAARRVPFVTVTSYSPEQCPSEFRKGPFVCKPFHIEALISELQKQGMSRTGMRADSPSAHPANSRTVVHAD